MTIITGIVLRHVETDPDQVYTDLRHTLRSYCNAAPNSLAERELTMDAVRLLLVLDGHIRRGGELPKVWRRSAP